MSMLNGKLARIMSQLSRYFQTKTHITPKTPPGPSPPSFGSTAIPPHAAELRTSKKYVHESMVPTKEGVAVFAGASRSQRKDMMVDLVRAEEFLLEELKSPGHGEPFV